MKSSSRRILSLLLAIIMFVVAFVVFSNFVVPEYARINELRAEYSAKFSALEEQRSILDNVNALLTKYQSIPKLSEVISNALPENEDVSSAFEQIYSIAQATGLSIQQLNVNTGISVTTANRRSSDVTPVLRSVGTAQMNLILVGSYDGLRAFLEAMESNMRVMDLVDLKVQSAGRISSGVLQFNLLINTYYQS